VPLTFIRPVQAAAVAGSHTSNLISESNDGLAPSNALHPAKRDGDPPRC